MYKRLTIALLSLLFAVVSYGQTIPESLIGNWINSSSNEWEYGFYEDFAIYESDFWDYKSIEEKRNKVLIELIKEGKSVSVEIAQDEKRGLSIKSGKGKKRYYQKMDKVYPTYTTHDATPFPEPTFRIDSVTIVGYYRNMDKIPAEFQAYYGLRYFSLNLNNFIGEDEIDFAIPIDSLGRFEITIPILNTQEAYADWKRLNKILVLQPGARITLFADLLDLLPREEDGGWEAYYARRKEVLFMGDGARLNNELIQYNNQWTESGEKDESSASAFFNYRKSNYDREKQELDEYLDSYPTLSKQFVDYYTLALRYGFAFSFMQYRFHLDRTKGERLPSEITEYMKEHFSINDPLAYTLSREFQRFLIDYLGYYKSIMLTEEDYTTVWNNVIEQLEENGLLTDELRELDEKMNALQLLYVAETDESKQEELLSQPENRILIEQFNASIQKGMDELHGQKMLKNKFVPGDSILANLSDLHELWDARIFYSHLNYIRLPLAGFAKEEFEKRIHNPYYAEYVSDKSNYYAAIAQQELINEKSLVYRNDLGGIEEADALFRELIEPYKGKVIYIDFWGTWCSPCRKNMAFMPAIKEELKDEEVIFIYFANNSPEDTWKSVIKEMGLTGANVVHYRLPGQQQRLLELHFSINSFPTYLIVNKAGEVVNRDAPSPQEKERLFEQLRKEL